LSADLKARFNATLDKYLDAKTSQKGFRVLACAKTPPAQRKKNRSDLLNHLRQYFAKFTQKQVKAPREIVANAKLNERGLLHLMWINSNLLEITGLRTEVDQVIKQINDLIEKPVEAKNSVMVKTEPVVNVKNLVNVNPEVSKPKEPAQKSQQAGAKEETFLINDLQWYQTRFLFEKKYFQYVADEFKELKVLLDKDLSKICFMGRKEEIDKAKDLALDILKNILGCEVDCEPALLEKMIVNESDYANLLRKEDICCVIDKTSAKNKFTIYAASVEEIQKCKDILQVKASC
jgi:hypothetical protein